MRWEVRRTSSCSQVTLPLQLVEAQPGDSRLGIEAQYTPVNYHLSIGQFFQNQCVWPDLAREAGSQARGPEGAGAEDLRQGKVDTTGFTRNNYFFNHVLTGVFNPYFGVSLTFKFYLSLDI